MPLQITRNKPLILRLLLGAGTLCLGARGTGIAQRGQIWLMQFYFSGKLGIMQLQKAQ